MKFKKFVIPTTIGAFLFAVVLGCGGVRESPPTLVPEYEDKYPLADTVPDAPTSDPVADTIPDEPTSDPIADADGVSDTAFEDLYFEWTDIKTNTGIPTFIGELKNPNSYPVDVTFDLTFYRGDEVYTEEDFYANCIAGGESVLVWGTPDIPLDAENRVDYEFTYVGESMYDPVPIRVTTNQLVVEGGPHIYVDIDEEFVIAEVGIVYYSGDELVALGTRVFFPGENGEYDDEVLEHYDSAEIYAQAYNYKY